MPTALLLELFKFAVPLVATVIKDYQAAHNGALPTDAEVIALFHQNIDVYLQEGAAWRASHPVQP